MRILVGATFALSYYVASSTYYTLALLYRSMPLNRAGEACPGSSLTCGAVLLSRQAYPGPIPPRLNVPLNLMDRLITVQHHPMTLPYTN